MTRPARRVLVTGAGGYLGRRIVGSLLEHSDSNVVLWMREGRDRSRSIRAEFAAYGARVQIAHGDLTDPEPFAGVSPESIDTIVHAAAVTRFNVESELADRINVEGLRRLIEWARRCPRLRRLTMLSTVYAHGLNEGTLREEPLPSRPEFANHYERSKWAAERLLIDEGADLPWQIHRIATVIAADSTGKVEQINAFHNTLKLLYYGLLSLVPGEEGTPLYFVTAEFVADAVRELSLGRRDRVVYQVCHTRAESATLGGLIDVAFERFETQSSFRKRRILRPLLCDARAFESLSSAVDSMGGPMVVQSLQSVVPFAPQLFSEKTFANDRLVADLQSYAAPDPKELLGSACAYLVETRWGAKEVARA